MLLTCPVILHVLLTVVAPLSMLSDQIVSYEALGEVMRVCLWVRQASMTTPVLQPPSERTLALFKRPILTLA